MPAGKPDIASAHYAGRAFYKLLKAGLRYSTISEILTPRPLSLTEYEVIGSAN
jgi:hypothetical protein